MLNQLFERMRRRMAYFKPKRFSDHYEYAEFFNVRYNLLAGDDMRVLEYRNPQVQACIFQHAVDQFDLTAKTILDVGCGLGYLKKYLDTHAPGYRSYQGIDLSAKMVAGARERFGNYFDRRDVLAQPFAENEFDVAFLLSVLGYPVTRDPFGYMSTLVRELYRVSRYGIALSHLAPRRRQEDSDFTVAPAEMAEWCRQNLSPHVTLDDSLGLVTYIVAVHKTQP